ncbi:hypothetical protein HUJ05_009796 [Dendroctonus ponderosae]|nr:hypothetical protein HUJ05_009796 [Dendroctonus ponderosae]
MNAYIYYKDKKQVLLYKNIFFATKVITSRAMAKLYFFASVGVLFLISFEPSLLIQLDDTYYAYQTNLTFVEALGACKELGMDLLRINSANESTYIHTIMADADVAISGIGYWMGGLYLNTGAWVWIETGVLLNYTKWGANEPNVTATGDYCLQLGKDNDGAFLLISYGSSSLMLPLNNTYYVSEYETTFLHALAGCKMIDMDLLRIESATESLNLYNLMDAAGLAVSGRAYWMGGAYLSDDSWVWIETGGVLSYTRWGANEPNMTGSGTHCLQLGKDNDGKSSINWQSRLCITSRYYICEVNS